MNRLVKGIVIATMLQLIFIAKIHAQITLSGRVLDTKTAEGLPGASIYFPDLKTGTTTGSEGTYQIKNLPKGTFSVSIKYLGYTSLNLSLNLTENRELDFQLTAGVLESKEFIVTGVSQATERSRMPVPVTLVAKTTLLQSASTNIIDALSKQAGISQLSTGQGISKPVIRGLGFNRVVIVNDGIRQEGQQWGDEHGLELDEFSVNSIEILKGPASLSFGSDAMAGVVHFISAPSADNGEIKADLLSNYQSNNAQQGYSASVSGNQNGFIWNARYSYKLAGNYRNRFDGKVFNSGFTENNWKALMGFNRKWGYSHLIFSRYGMQVGLPEGERDSTSGAFTKEALLADGSTENEVVSKAELEQYGLSIPQQSILHTKLVWDNSFVLNSGRLNARLAYQDNQRKEFGSVTEPYLANLHFDLKTTTADFRYLFPEHKGRSLSIGISSMLQSSSNKGIEYLIPEYNLADAGAFVLAKKSYDKLDISGGIRYDMRFQAGEALFLDSNGMQSTVASGTQLLFPEFHSRFSGISGSIGATYQFSTLLLGKLNLSKGYRAPNIAELSSNGAHEGTLRYEIGNLQLKPESSYQTDLQLAFTDEHFSIEMDAFANRIQHFIFPVKLAAIAGGDSLNDGLSSYRFMAGNALLMGGELSMDLHPHPLDWLHVENTFSFVQAQQLNQSDSTRYLPFTPAPKLVSELKADFKQVGKFIAALYLKLELESYFSQNKIYAANATETATAGYQLINAGAGADILNKNKRVLFSIYLSGNNLADVAYQSHLSRLKYAPENYANNRRGIYNMGRNFSVKLLVPIQIKKPS